jgi:hypothetical protein
MFVVVAVVVVLVKREMNKMKKTLVVFGKVLGCSVAKSCQ